jgi:hypothetical protein
VRWSGGAIAQKMKSKNFTFCACSPHGWCDLERLVLIRILWCSTVSLTGERNEKTGNSPLNPPFLFFHAVDMASHSYQGIRFAHAVYQVSRLTRDAIYLYLL